MWLPVDLTEATDPVGEDERAGGRGAKGVDMGPWTPSGAKGFSGALAARAARRLAVMVDDGWLD